MSFVITRQRIKPSLHPSNGYRFKDALGVTHIAPSLSKLVECVERYRERLDLPPGDPLAEITAYICKRQPQICTDNAPSLSAKALMVHVLHDIANEARRTRVGVPLEESLRRTSICLTCPFAVDLNKVCAPCFQPAGETIRKILGKPEDPRLEGKCCSQARDALSLAVTKMNPRACAEAPENCWRKEA